MKRKIVCLLIVATFVMSTFIGCGGEETSSMYATDTTESISEEAATDSTDEGFYSDYDGEIEDIEDTVNDVESDSSVTEVDMADDTVTESADSTDATDTEAVDDAETGTDAQQEAADESDTTTSESSTSDATTSRKIIYTADISINTKEYDKDIASIKSLVNRNGGYFESTNMSGTAAAEDRSASFTIRIPAENYDSFMNSIGGINTIVSQTESAEDITSSYVDVQARLKSLKTKKARLEEFEAQATDLDDILDYENQINDVQYEIERYTALLNTYKDQTSNCTINMYIEEVTEYVEPEPEDDSFADEILSTFFESIEILKSIFEGLVIVIIFLIPFAIVGGIILLIVLKIKKSRPEKEKKEITKKEVTTPATDSSENKKDTYNGPTY